MANDAVRVELPERACVVALGHFRLDGSPLQPESCAAILRSAESAHGHVQTVTCTASFAIIAILVSSMPPGWLGAVARPRSSA